MISRPISVNIESVFTSTDTSSKQNDLVWLLYSYQQWHWIDFGERKILMCSRSYWS